MKIARWALHAALGASTGLLGAMAPQAAAGDRATPAVEEKSSPIDQYTDLSKAATKARLAEFRDSPKLAAALDAVSGKLAEDGVTADQLEGDVLPLVRDREPADADISLAAVMLYHYRKELKDTADPGAKLESRDTLLTTAAFGRLPKRYTRIRR